MKHDHRRSVEASAMAGVAIAAHGNAGNRAGETRAQQDGCGKLWLKTRKPLSLANADNSLPSKNDGVRDAQLAERQTAWLLDQLVWDHIQEQKHHGSG
jgi:hypothetical protein